MAYEARLEQRRGPLWLFPRTLEKHQLESGKQHEFTLGKEKVAVGVTSTGGSVSFTHIEGSVTVKAASEPESQKPRYSVLLEERKKDLHVNRAAAVALSKSAPSLRVRVLGDEDTRPLILGSLPEQIILAVRHAVEETFAF